MDLIIMAAGMGSRFGGLKQIKPIDEQGNFIIDYSIYDAIRCGFDKVIFIIKRENFDVFKQTIGKRIENQIKVEYIFQDLNSFVPNNFDISSRTKPWGTAHAILCAKGKTSNNFAVINADDFYGANSFKILANFLNNNQNNNNFAMVGFKTINTLTENGSVKRGICNTLNGNLISLDESSIYNLNNKIIAKSIVLNNCEHEISPNTLVSMNLFGLSNNIFDYLENGFYNFLETNKSDLTNCEYFIPTILTNYINDNLGNIKVLDTDDKWYGLTYKEDFDNVFKGINNLRLNNIYPKKLWKK